MKMFCTLSSILFLMVSVSAEAETSPMCPGEEGYFYVNYQRRNPQAGGFVSYQADVDDSDDVFIAPTAAICGSSSIRDSARIYGTAIVSNSEVYGSARVYGNARVSSNSEIYGEARVYGNSQVIQSRIFGDATVEGWFKAVNTEISSGKNTAPQFTEQQLREMQRAQENLLALRKKLGSILEKNPVVGDYHTFQLALIPKADPCQLEFSNGGQFNLHYITNMQSGIDNANTIEAYEDQNFKSEYYSNNPYNSKYYFAYTGKTETWNMTAVPLVVISKSPIEEIFFDRIGELWLPYNSNSQRIYFTKASTRNEFFSTLKELYNSCPAI